MTNDASPGTRILGSLRSADGAGVVRIEDRYDTDIDDLWSAISDPVRLARWHGRAEGDLRLGGEFRLYLEADDIDSTGRIDACEPPRRLVVTTRETDESYRKGQGVPPFDAVKEITLTADGDQTILVIEVGACPWTRSRSSVPGGRSMQKTSRRTSPEAIRVTARHAGANSYLRIRNWRPPSPSRSTRLRSELDPRPTPRAHDPTR